VGEAIFRNRKHLDDPDEWDRIASQCLLYRVFPDFQEPTGYSGIVIYTEDGHREDGTIGPAVAGFQSFAKISINETRVDVDGAMFKSKLKEGHVAFYGAFPVPEVMRKRHVIL
jgi:hypothetical protein